MGDLGRSDNHDPSLLHISITDRILNMTVLNRRCLIPALHLHKTRFLNSFRVISIPDRRVSENIVRVFLMNLRRSILHRLMYVQDKRQLFILYLQCPQSLGRRHFVLRNNSSHIISVISDMPLQKQTVRHILMRRFR